MYLEKAIFKNISPFGNLEMMFGSNQLIIFSGINGKGKTTVLSYIADAFFEMAKVANFEDVLEDSAKYYRVTSSSNTFNYAEFSLVYLRFVNNGKNIDYLEVVGQLDQEKYDKCCTLIGKIQFKEIENNLKSMGSCKLIKIDMTEMRDVFYKNILTYFPFDRSEVPVWMNDIEYKEHRFNTKTRFSNKLNKNIESRAISDQVADWILDVILDYTVSVKSIAGQVLYTDKYSQTIYENLNLILQKVLSGKTDTCRLGIGQRKSGKSRISIVKEMNGKIINISPSIFHLSSGEISLFILFAEIIKQYDIYHMTASLNLAEITGVVIIDEIDKHLHIKLQKEVLPILLSLFPNLQFLVSSHSPFFALGVSETLKNRVRFIDLTLGGKDISISKIDELDDVYNQILTVNDNYKELYKQLESDFVKSKSLRILTEGNNTKYIKEAIRILAPDLENQIYICTGIEGKSGKNQLIQTYEVLSKTDAYEKTLFVWDCDAVNDTKKLNETNAVFNFTFSKNEMNQKITKGIENLFDQSYIKKEYYLTKEKTTELGEEQKIETFEKDKFCRAMLELGSGQVFSKFQPLIEKIKGIISS